MVPRKIGGTPPNSQISTEQTHKRDCHFLFFFIGKFFDVFPNSQAKFLFCIDLFIGKIFDVFSRTPKRNFHFSLTFSIGKMFDFFFKSRKKFDIFDMCFLDFLNENVSCINLKFPQESKNHT